MYLAQMYVNFRLQLYRQADRQAGRLKDRQAERQTEQLFNHPTDHLLDSEPTSQSTSQTDREAGVCDVLLGVGACGYVLQVPRVKQLRALQSQLLTATQEHTQVVLKEERRQNIT